MTVCPHCGGDVEQLISAPAVQFKGSGWYVTDYAKKSSSKGNSSSGNGSASASSSDSKTDTSNSSGSSTSEKGSASSDKPVEKK